MTKKQLLVLKVLLFLSGLGIIAGAFCICGFNVKDLSALDKYLWININVFYIILFEPLFFNFVTTDNAAAKTPSLVAEWISSISIVVICLPLVICIYNQVLFSVQFGIIVETVLIFLGLTFGYFGLLGSSQIEKVAAQETSRLNPVKEIRSQAEFLVFRADSLPAKYAAERTRISKIQENVRYMVPVKSPLAPELEQKIITGFQSLTSAIDDVISGSDAGNLRQILSGLETAVAQRKLLLS